MARFTIRVELLGAHNESDYEELHKKMQARDFLRFIKTNTGKWLRLPPAEYNYDGGGYGAADEVKMAVSAVAKTTRFVYRILVTKSEERSWENLEEA